MEEKRNLRKERIGVVSSNKGDKTITVTVKWKEKHPIYGKFVNKTKKWRLWIRFRFVRNLREESCARSD